MKSFSSIISTFLISSSCGLIGMGKKDDSLYGYSMTRNNVCNRCGSTALKQHKPPCTNMPLCMTRQRPMETATLLNPTDFKGGQQSLPAYHSNGGSTTPLQTLPTRPAAGLHDTLEIRTALKLCWIKGHEFGRVNKESYCSVVQMWTDLQKYK